MVAVDEAQGLGLGTALMERLARAATERGVERFQCFLLVDNLAMKHLLIDLADDVSFDDLHDGVIEARVVLTPEPRRVWRDLVRLAGQETLKLVRRDPTER